MSGASSNEPGGPGVRKRGAAEWVALAGIGLVWLALWNRSFPAPYFDDAWFLGPAVSLATGEGLTNPWMRPWLVERFSSERYLLHAPLASYATAGALSLTGISARSVVGYQCLLGLLLSACVWTMLRRIGVGMWAAAAAVVAVSGYVLTRGLRPDALAALLLCASVSALRHPGYRWWAAGCLGLALAPLALPVTATLSVPLFLAALWMRRRDLGRRGVLARVAIVSAAVGVALLLGLWMIDFEVREFARMFLRTAAMRVAPAGERWDAFAGKLLLGREPLLSLPVWIAFGVLCVHALLAPRAREAAALAAFVILAALLLGLVLYAQYMPVLLKPAIALVGIAAFCRSAGSRRAQAAGAVFAGVVLLGWLPAWVPVVVGAAEPVAHYQQVEEQVRRLPRQRLLVDEVAARHVFDYRLPRDAHDWVAMLIFDRGVVPRIAAKPPGEAWVVDERKLAIHVPDSGVRLEHLQVAGRSFERLQLHPRRLAVVP